MNGSDLFDGTEDASTRLSDLEGDTPIHPPGAAPFDVRAILGQWAKGLEYDEVHALVVGFSPLFVALVLLGIPAVPAWLTTGLLSLSLTLGGIAVYGVGTRSRKLSRYIKIEPHYLLGGQAVAAMVGALIMAILRVFFFALGVVA